MKLCLQEGEVCLDNEWAGVLLLPVFQHFPGFTEMGLGCL